MNVINEANVIYEQTEPKHIIVISNNYHLALSISQEKNQTSEKRHHHHHLGKLV